MKLLHHALEKSPALGLLSCALLLLGTSQDRSRLRRLDIENADGVVVCTITSSDRGDGMLVLYNHEGKRGVTLDQLIDLGGSLALHDAESRIRTVFAHNTLKMSDTTIRSDGSIELHGPNGASRVLSAE